MCWKLPRNNDQCTELSDLNKSEHFLKRNRQNNTLGFTHIRKPNVLNKTKKFDCQIPFIYYKRFFYCVKGISKAKRKVSERCK